ncbi:hypothetical protein [Anaeromicropila herbilytica]|uniref:Uncharacterized protein n=1 Tax=Anaeromicropila herbilytica TaxID=2785025 RepID=A0A7R7IEV3_9FIRM|nr:hypothetical protein [Anaeromicropila herbilytica]BCN31493.1 hypothetical protein bsdtb5_27880 [Anaeromicropila herbilytica]
MKKKLVFIVSLLFMLCVTSIPVTTSAAAEKNVTKSFKETKKVTKLVNELNDWTGYQYIYLLKNGEKKTVQLTDKNILNIAGFNYYEPNLGDIATATQKGIIKRTNLLFGKKPNLTTLNTYDSKTAQEQMNKNGEFISVVSGGAITTMVGDWGTYAPSMKVLKITKVNQKTFHVYVETYFREVGTKKKDYYGVTKFTIQKTTNKSSNGYIITGIKLQKAKKVAK